jgi:uncharacterized protein YkwD
VRLLRVAVPAFACVVVAAVAPGVAGAASCSGATESPAQLGGKVNTVTLCLLNQQRAAHHLRALKLDHKLSHAALGHSQEMVAKRYFAHESRSGAPFTARIKSAGWTRGRRSWMLGENIGWGTGSLATPAAMVRAWMHSAGHRANILQGRFREIGIGVANGSPNGAAGATYSTDFGG